MIAIGNTAVPVIAELGLLHAKFQVLRAVICGIGEHHH
jgi:hypothetical protein